MQAMGYVCEGDSYPNGYHRYNMTIKTDEDDAGGG